MIIKCTALDMTIWMGEAGLTDYRPLLSRADFPSWFENRGELILGSDEFFGNAAHTISSCSNVVYLHARTGAAIATSATATANTACVRATIRVTESWWWCKV